jgi:hypothetical protein
MGWLEKLQSTPAEQWFRGAVVEKHGAQGNAAIVTADDCYISVFLESLYMGSVRKGLTRFYGTVTSHCSIPSLDGGRAEAVVATTPASLKDADAKNLDRVVIDGRRLFGPTPYRGGDLDVEVGLFLVPTQNLIGPYLEVVEDIAKLAAAPYVAAAAPFIGPATKALGLLLGDNGGNVELQIGLAKSWSSPEIGLFAVARRGFAGDLLYDRSQRRLAADGKAISEPHLVLRFESTKSRDDWHQIPDLLNAYNDLKRAALSNNLKQAEAAVEAFRLRAQFSPDLIRADAVRLTKKCMEAFKQAFPAVQTAAEPAPPTLPDFASLNLYG